MASAAPCSPSTRMAQGLGICIVLLVLLLVATGLSRTPDWFYRATPFMGQLRVVAVRATARCSPFTLMAPGLRICIVSRREPLTLTAFTLTATERVRLPDWSCLATPF